MIKVNKSTNTDHRSAGVLDPIKIINDCSCSLGINKLLNTHTYNWSFFRAKLEWFPSFSHWACLSRLVHGIDISVLAKNNNDWKMNQFILLLFQELCFYFSFGLFLIFRLGLFNDQNACTGEYFFTRLP